MYRFDEKDSEDNHSELAAVGGYSSIPIELRNNIGIGKFLISISSVNPIEDNFELTINTTIEIELITDLNVTIDDIYCIQNVDELISNQLNVVRDLKKEIVKNNMDVESRRGSRVMNCPENYIDSRKHSLKISVRSNYNEPPTNIVNEELRKHSNLVKEEFNKYVSDMDDLSDDTKNNTTKISAPFYSNEYKKSTKRGLTRKSVEVEKRTATVNENAKKTPLVFVYNRRGEYLLGDDQIEYVEVKGKNSSCIIAWCFILHNIKVILLTRKAFLE